MDLGKRIQKATSQTLNFHLLMEGNLPLCIYLQTADRHLTPGIQHPSQYTFYSCTPDSVSNMHSQQRRKSALVHAKMCLKSSLKHLLWNRTLWKDSPSFRSYLYVKIDMSFLQSLYLTRKCVSNYCPKVFSFQSCLVS